MLTFITNTAHYTEVLSRVLHVKVFVDWNGKIRNGANLIDI